MIATHSHALYYISESDRKLSITEHDYTVLHYTDFIKVSIFLACECKFANN